jgi:hypothetical protein
LLLKSSDYNKNDHALDSQADDEQSSNLKNKRKQLPTTLSKAGKVMQLLKNVYKENKAHSNDSNLLQTKQASFDYTSQSKICLFLKVKEVYLLNMAKRKKKIV